MSVGKSIHASEMISRQKIPCVKLRFYSFKQQGEIAAISEQFSPLITFTVEEQLQNVIKHVGN